MPILCLMLFGVSLVLLFLFLDARMKIREYEIQINTLEAEKVTKHELAMNETPELLNQAAPDLSEKAAELSAAGSVFGSAEGKLQGTEADPQTAAATSPQNTGNDFDLQQRAAQEAETEPSDADKMAGSDAVRPMPTVEELQPGTVLDATAVSGREDAMFAILEIHEGDAVFNRINGKSYRENPNIGLSDLRYLKMIHYNFEHQIQVGEMIVNQAIAQDVINIFRELYDIGYEIQSMYLIDNYWTGDGDSSDSASIDVNNTSSFCYRTATGSGNLSNHAYGRAIDLNPQQNPYVWYDSNGSLRWSHANADPYIDRTTGDPHVITAGDACYNIFIKYGFSWGGNWGNPIDYQHFEKRG